MSDLALALVVAGATAIGAAIGGAITGAVTLKAEDKRQAFSRELEQRRFDERTADRVAELRVAVRLVVDELGAARSRIKAAETLAVTPMTVPRACWDAHREVLARVLSIEAWTAVSSAHGMLDLYRPSLEKGAAHKASLAPLIQELDAAVEALVPYAAGASIPLQVDMPSPPGDDPARAAPPDQGGHQGT